MIIKEPATFEHNGFKFVQQATLVPRSLNGGIKAIYSQEYPPLYVFWGGEAMTAKEIVNRLWRLSR